jgi:hypothetical protein
METGSPRLATWQIALLATGVAAAATLVLVHLVHWIIPPCGGPWCFDGVLYLPVPAIGATLSAASVARYARRGRWAYAIALMAGAIGHVVAWVQLQGGMPLSPF